MRSSLARRGFALKWPRKVFIVPRRRSDESRAFEVRHVAFEGDFSMSDERNKVPDQEELEKELSNYLSKKYGCRIKVVSPMMMAKEKEKEPGKQEPDLKGVDRIKFDMKPEELEEYLDRYVVKQEEAKAVLATKICTHYNRARQRRRKARYKTDESVGRIKNNIILMGPTGVGKTYLVKLVARKLGVPFVKGDATKFSETGYVGGDVEDLIRDLVVEAGDDLELAQYGIVYVDEVDKIASHSRLLGPDVSRAGVQRALLKPMEETEVDLKVPHDPISQIQAIEHYRKTGKREKRTVSTRDILFIVSGAFNGLSDIVKERVSKQGVGFGADIQSRGDEGKYLGRCKAEDLVEYGFESEFIGRLPVMAVLEPLEAEDLYEILENPNNPIVLGKKEDFRCYGIDLRFEEDALRLVARRAHEEKTGARALVSVMEKVLLPFEKKLPSTSISYLVVTRDVVEDPRGQLETMLQHPDDPQRFHLYEERAALEKRRVLDDVTDRKRHQMETYPLVFTPQRIELVVDHHLKAGSPVDSIFEEMILLYNQIRVFESDFYEKHGFKIHFNEEAINEIISRSLDDGITATSICRNISRDYDYGFRLVADKSGQTQFILPKEAVVQPGDYLDELIRGSCSEFPFNPAELSKKY